MLYKAGAKEVHVRIACPEIKYPDFYGVDMPTKKELLSSSKNKNEICDFLGSATCDFLSIEGLYKALLNAKRNNNYPQFSDHYFTGEYPIKALDKLGNEKITQLSLLSNKSSS